MDLDQKVEALTASIRELAAELTDKKDLPTDRVVQIEAEITAKSAALDELEQAKAQRNVQAQLSALTDRLNAYTRENAQTKTAAILAGIDAQAGSMKSVGRY